MTCAHPTAPFGARLKVTDLESGRSVVARVTDRGPFKRGRAVDLSIAAARELGMVERGLARGARRGDRRTNRAPRARPPPRAASAPARIAAIASRVVGPPNTAVPATSTSRPPPRRGRRRLGLHAAVHLDLERRAARRPARGAADLVGAGLDVTLPAEAGVHRHDEHHLAVADHPLDRGERRRG